MVVLSHTPRTKTIQTVLNKKLDQNNWGNCLLLVILSINNFDKANLRCSSAELVFRQTLRLYGDLCFNTPQALTAFPDDFVLSWQKIASEFKPTDTQIKESNPVYLPKSLNTCTYIYVRSDPIGQNLMPSHDSLFIVHSNTDKTFKIFRKGNLSSFAINNLEPAFTLHDALS